MCSGAGEPMLKALGVPWVVRKALASCTVSKVITHERRATGDRWCEMTTTSIITKAQELFLDGREQVSHTRLNDKPSRLAANDIHVL